MFIEFTQNIPIDIHIHKWVQRKYIYIYLYLHIVYNESLDDFDWRNITLTHFTFYPIPTCFYIYIYCLERVHHDNTYKFYIT